MNLSPRFADDWRKQTSKTLIIIAHKTFSITKRPIKTTEYQNTNMTAFEGKNNLYGFPTPLKFHEEIESYK